MGRIQFRYSVTSVVALCLAIAGCNTGDDSKASLPEPTAVAFETVEHEAPSFEEIEQQKENARHQRIVDNPSLFDELSENEKWVFLKKELHELHFTWYQVIGATRRHIAYRQILKEKMKFWKSKGRDSGFSDSQLNSMLTITREDLNLLNRMPHIDP